MSDLKSAILDAKYIDMISLGDFIVQDCGLPDVDAEGNLMPQAAEIAAALFRWAAEVEPMPRRAVAAGFDTGAEIDAADAGRAAEASADVGDSVEMPPLQEYDEYGDPIMDAEEAARLEAQRLAQAKETA